MILEPVTKACPGLRDALFLLAKARYLAGDIKAAMSTLQHVVDNLDPTLAEAHLLMAQIQLHQVRNCTYMNVRPAENIFYNVIQTIMMLDVLLHILGQLLKRSTKSRGWTEL